MKEHAESKFLNLHLLKMTDHSYVVESQREQMRANETASLHCASFLRRVRESFSALFLRLNLRVANALDSAHVKEMVAW